MKISRSVYLYPGGRMASNTYVIRGRDKQILIDLGRGRSIKNLQQVMAKDGLNLFDTNEIAITHAHPDHSKVDFLAKKLNCRVRGHPKGLDIMSAASPWRVFVAKQRKLAGRWAKELECWPDALLIGGGTIFFGRWKQIKGFRIFHDREVIDLGGGVRVKVIFLPGHTEDSVAFWVGRERVMVTGDLLRTDGRKYGFPCFNTAQANLGQAMKSLKMMKWSRINILAPGHGRVLEGWPQIRGLVTDNIKTCRLSEKKLIQFLSENKSKFTLCQAAAYLDSFWAPDMTLGNKLYFILTLLKKARIFIFNYSPK